MLERPEDSRSMAALLAPKLADSTRGRLGEITWFRTDWQRGGAATGSATWTDQGSAFPVVVKLPVNQRELSWLRRLQPAGDGVAGCVPHLYDSGTEINGYDLAWVVMERFPFGPLGIEWHDEHVPRVAGALAEFHARAANHEIDQPARQEDWAALLGLADESVRINHIAEQSRWQKGLRALRNRLDEVAGAWERRPVTDWLHGDAHFANAMSRDGLAAGTVSLIDFAEVHAGHWIEDAVFLERQLWARPERMARWNPVREVARARRSTGRPVGPEWPRLAMVRRLLLAATAPRFIRSEGHPAHLAACLEWLERGLREVDQVPPGG